MNFTSKNSQYLKKPFCEVLVLQSIVDKDCNCMRGSKKYNYNCVHVLWIEVLHCKFGPYELWSAEFADQIPHGPNLCMECRSCKQFDCTSLFVLSSVCVFLLLGYIVFSGIRRASGVQGLRVIVQSDKHPDYVDSRIEAFLFKMKVPCLLSCLMPNAAVM